MNRLANILVLITAFAVTVPASATSNAPDRLGKTAARELASAMVDSCNDTGDALACLKDRGGECAAVGDAGDRIYRCVYELSISATKAHRSGSPAKKWDFEAIFLVKHSSKGWRARTESVKELKD